MNLYDKKYFMTIVSTNIKRLMFFLVYNYYLGVHALEQKTIMYICFFLKDQDLSIGVYQFRVFIYIDNKYFQINLFFKCFLFNDFILY